MKTTVEIPDGLLRDAKALAAREGVPLRQFLTEAVAEKVRTSRQLARERPWLRMAGAFKKYKRELAEVQAAIDAEFEIINPDEWA